MIISPQRPVCRQAGTEDAEKTERQGVEVLCALRACLPAAGRQAGRQVSVVRI